eukprot:CAMPEP_0181219698 /NCGR_PEP_ID=MMETSP1096-20121128/28429_1 /TAXON_ID=156174 ORGANISM="Chrysochromulina ericina, Strain CCMP281" /NCGR_SAMPLE_ID=MMETSP1096 /ASSEMBLY_ACC=CAM_ASM_000453 /LENGTH=297 /DNA_ID=CAMNT_0023312125 /DNA_START=59 /DNA_END=949 /DNA_ORIENTATION=-
MNMNNMIIENVRSHDYFKGLGDMKTFEEVIDQIYYDVTYVTPWKPGTHKTQRASGMCSGLRGVSNAGIPSSAYMLMFKLFTLQLTKAQIQRMLDHADSPYIRVIGFLYLRHCCDPKQIWGWVEKYIDDAETFDETGEQNASSSIPVGQFLRRILVEQEFHDTMLPRLPVPIARAIQKNLDENPAQGQPAGGSTANWEQRPDEKGGDGRPQRDERAPPPRDEPVAYRDLDNPSGLRGDAREGERRGGYDARREDRREDHRGRDDHRDRGRDDGRGEYRRDEPRGYERRDERREYDGPD